jgi:hypothetical protein
MELVGDGIKEAQEYYTANQKAVEEALGVK